MTSYNRRDIMRQASALGLSIVGLSTIGGRARADQEFILFHMVRL